MAIQLLPMLAGFVIISGQISSMMHLYPPLFNGYQKKAFSSYPNLNPTVTELINLYYLKEITETDFLERCAENGFANDVAMNLYNASQTWLSINDYVTLWRREEITETELDDNLKGLRVHEATIPQIKKVTEFFPSAPDLIRFAVREVYTPSAVQEFGMMEDLPEEFLKEASKAGLPEEQAKNYWASHWELPSINQGFEMLHRGVIDDKKLTSLLKAKDFMPGWRKQLTDISYNPLTRVDVRRMFGMGVLNTGDVKKAYLDIGYSPENADLMTEFTVALNSEETTGLTRGSVMSAYKKGVLTEEQYTAFLKDLDYSDEVVAFWVSVANYDITMELIEDTEKELISQYRLGLIGIDDVRTELHKLEMPESYINNVMAKIAATRSEKVKLPSQGKLDKWLEVGVINEKTYFNRMKDLGYSDSDVENFLSEIELEVPMEKRKFLGIKVYTRWLKSGILNATRFRAIGAEMKISERDIDNLIMEVGQTSG